MSDTKRIDDLEQELWDVKKQLAELKNEFDKYKNKHQSALNAARRLIPIR